MISADGPTATNTDSAISVHAGPVSIWRGGPTEPGRVPCVVLFRAPLNAGSVLWTG